MKIAKLKINMDLDCVKLDVDQGTGFGTVYRWKCSDFTTDQRSNIIETAKRTLYDEAWKLAEMGYKIELIPYIN